MTWGGGLTCRVAPSYTPARAQTEAVTLTQTHRGGLMRGSHLHGHAGANTVTHGLTRSVPGIAARAQSSRVMHVHTHGDRRDGTHMHTALESRTYSDTPTRTPARTPTHARAHHTPEPWPLSTSSQSRGPLPPSSVGSGQVLLGLRPDPAGADSSGSWSRGGSDKTATQVTAATTRVGLSRRPVRTAHARRDNGGPRGGTTRARAAGQRGPARRSRELQLPEGAAPGGPEAPCPVR